MIITNKQEQAFRELINDTGSREQYEYLTIPCNTRTRQTAARARSLVNAGNFSAALKTADPIAYNVGLNDYCREHQR